MDKIQAARIISEHTGISTRTILEQMEQTYPVYRMTDHGVYQFKYANPHTEVQLDVARGEYRLQLVRTFWNRQGKVCSETYFKRLLQSKYGIPTKGRTLQTSKRERERVYEILSERGYAEIRYKEGEEFTTKICRVYQGAVGA